MNKLKSLLILFLLQFSIVKAQNNIDFTIVGNDKLCSVNIDKNDYKVVEVAAKIFIKDVKSITGKQLKISDDLSSTMIIAGTLGNNKLVNSLIKQKRIDVFAIQDSWETYSFHVVENPFDGVDKALVIVGSDRRGTAYGILELSRMMGVSPWEWWSDVTPNESETVKLSIQNKVSNEPSVKYRGVFLNDEDWGLQRWAALNFEPEIGDMGPKTYAKVFELLLRLRANTIWPAMHRSTKPFYSYPENKQVADDYAIVIGTSHAEPMLSNINTEWNHETMGDYRYDTNAEVIKKLFTKRIRETAKFENIYTTGMRGEHDSPMIVGEDDTDQQVKLLEKIITDQRAILKQEIKKSRNTIPQAFVPYKEVLTYYQNGLNLPEDITLVWTDDNYGYIRQLSTPEEQNREGGAGVYYHTSYWGRPHDYLWLNSTNPVLMWEEMVKAYEFKSRDLWILNCGDIKPHEYNIELFLDMAWDMRPFEKSIAVKKHMTNWAAREFGENVANETTNLLFENNRLSYIRRPEFMAWSQVEPVTKAGETELTQYHYSDEVTTRIDAYERLVEASDRLYKTIPENRKDAFYQLVYYPIIGASKLNQKWLYYYKNKFSALQGKQSAHFYGEQSANAYNSILKETNYYNKALAEGKWNHIMTMQPRFLPVFSKPVSSVVDFNGKPTLGVALEGYEMELNHDIINSFADVLPVFNSYTDNRYFIDVFIKGEGQVAWKAIPRTDWIKISETEGVLTNVNNKQEKRIWVSIDWDKVPKGENKKEAPLGHDFQLIPPSYKVNSAIDFVSADSTITVGVSVFNPKLKSLEDYKGFIEDKGFVSIHAENPTRNISGKEAKWELYEGIGYTGKVITALPRSVSSITDLDLIQQNNPSLEYDFYTFNFGEVDVNIQAVPTHAIHKGRGVRCAISIDDAEPVIVDFQTFGRSEKWKQNVLKNASVQSVKQIVNKAGKHTLKIWMVDAGVMLDQILIDLGGWKSSYSFPNETLIKR